MAKGFQKSVKKPEKRNSLLQESNFLSESFLKNFESLNDPRIDRSKDHLLIDIVAISIHQLVLGQKKVKAKSNEITAIPALIEMLEIENSIITIDAMGCQKEITSLIRKKKGDYMIALKANQKCLHQERKEWFKIAESEQFKDREYSYYQSIETGHHRIEKREVFAISVSSLPGLHHQSLWSGLKTVVMVKSERQLWNKTTTEVRFYISSIEKDAQKIGAAIRSHWGIENSLHWTLDVIFSEDKSRIRTR